MKDNKVAFLAAVLQEKIVSGQVRKKTAGGAAALSHKKLSVKKT